MLRRIVPIVVLLSLILVLSISASFGDSARNSQLIKATWIEPQVLGDIVSIPASEVENDKITHFEFVTQDKDMTFMAYDLNGEIYIRANICPPCHSIGFSLQQGTLVCDTCGTVFDAETGVGISGACVAYPKAAVPYEINDGNITMQGNDLATAYQDTVNSTQPSAATAPSCHSGSGTSAAPGRCGGSETPRPPGCCGI